MAGWCGVITKPLKPKKCKVCHAVFQPVRALQSVCGMACAVALSAEARKKADRKEIRIAKEKAKTRGQWLKEAQAAFNRFIRLRDNALPCISCGRHHQGQYHAGHYRPTSTSPAIRFHELNVHKQCAPCNDHLHGNLTKYRPALILKIGLESVEWLEQDHPPAHYSILDLQQIKAVYSAKARELERNGNT